MASIESYAILLKAVNNEIQSTRPRPAAISEDRNRSPVQDGKCTKSGGDIHDATEVFMYTTGKETGNLAVSAAAAKVDSPQAGAAPGVCLDCSLCPECRPRPQTI